MRFATRAVRRGDGGDIGHGVPSSGESEQHRPPSQPAALRSRTIRGSEQEIETTLGDYKPVDGYFIPFSIEFGRKGQEKQKLNWDKVEANVTIDDSRFRKPEIK